MLWCYGAPCQSFEINPWHNQQAASHDFNHMGGADFEDCFNVFASFTWLISNQAFTVHSDDFLSHCFNSGMERLHYSVSIAFNMKPFQAQQWALPCPAEVSEVIWEIGKLHDEEVTKCFCLIKLKSLLDLNTVCCSWYKRPVASVKVTTTQKLLVKVCPLANSQKLVGFHRNLCSSAIPGLTTQQLPSHLRLYRPKLASSNSIKELN